MPWCPNCRVEYREGYKTCSDCNIELVTESEPIVENSGLVSYPIRGGRSMNALFGLAAMPDKNCSLLKPRLSCKINNIII